MSDSNDSRGSDDVKVPPSRRRLKSTIHVTPFKEPYNPSKPFTEYQMVFDNHCFTFDVPTDKQVGLLYSSIGEHGRRKIEAGARKDHMQWTDASLAEVYTWMQANPFMASMTQDRAV